MTDLDRASLLGALAASAAVANITTIHSGNATVSGVENHSSILADVNATAEAIRKLLAANANSSGAEGQSDVEHERRYWVLCLLLFPCFTIFGNVLVVLSVVRERSLQSVTNYFIVSLAFADILVGAIVMPISVFVEVMNGVWQFASILCDLWIMCDALFSTASILNLVAISIDRFIAVTQPIKYSKHKNSKRTHVTIAATWLLSMAIALPIGCGLQNLNGIRSRPEFKDTCTFFHGDFLIYSSLGSFYIPCVVMLVLYYRIFKVIWRRAKKAASAKKAGCSGGRGGGKIYANCKATTSVAATCADDATTTAAAGAAEAAEAADAAEAVPEDEVRRALVIVHASPRRPNNLSLSLSHGGGGSGQCGRQNSSSLSSHHSRRSRRRGNSGCSVHGGAWDDEEDDDEADYEDEEAGNCSMALNDSFAAPGAAPSDDNNSEICETRLNNRSSLTSATAVSSGKSRKPKKKPSRVQQLDSSWARKAFQLNLRRNRGKGRAERSAAKREKKATKTLAIVLGVFLLCWLPFFISNLMWAACLKSIDTELFNGPLCSYDRRIGVFIVWLGYVNSTLNPLIYTIFNNEFRKAFKKLLHFH